MSSGLISELRANGILAANASANIANMNTQGYRAITTTLVEDGQGAPAAVTGTSGAPPAQGFEGMGGSNVDAAGEIVALMRAKTGFEAALTAIGAAEEMMDDLMAAFSRR